MKKEYDQEKAMRRVKELEALSKPLIKWLNENFHPHVTVIITPTSTELLEGLCAAPVTEYIKD
jgi:hypothetical protein